MEDGDGNGDREVIQEEVASLAGVPLGVEEDIEEQPFGDDESLAEGPLQRSQSWLEGAAERNPLAHVMKLRLSKCEKELGKTMGQLQKRQEEVDRLAEECSATRAEVEIQESRAEALKCELQRRDKLVAELRSHDAVASIEDDAAAAKETRVLKEQLRFLNAVINRLAADLQQKTLELNRAAQRGDSEGSSDPSSLQPGTPSEALQEQLHEATALAGELRASAEGERQRCEESLEAHSEVIARERRLRAAVEAGLREKVQRLRSEAAGDRLISSTEITALRRQLKEALKLAHTRESDLKATRAALRASEEVAAGAHASASERAKLIESLEAKLDAAASAVAEQRSAMPQQLTHALAGQQKELERLRHELQVRDTWEKQVAALAAQAGSGSDQPSLLPHIVMQLEGLASSDRSEWGGTAEAGTGTGPEVAVASLSTQLQGIQAALVQWKSDKRDLEERLAAEAERATAAEAAAERACAVAKRRHAVEGEVTKLRAALGAMAERVQSKEREAKEAVERADAAASRCDAQELHVQQLTQLNRAMAASMERLEEAVCRATSQLNAVRRKNSALQHDVRELVEVLQQEDEGEQEERERRMKQALELAEGVLDEAKSEAVRATSDDRSPHRAGEAAKEGTRLDWVGGVVTPASGSFTRGSSFLSPRGAVGR
ncbi:unnamed protein product [Chrysoparadoxa australica]